MNILMIAQYDWSGAGYATAKAINEHTEHVARHISLAKTYIDYPVDIFKPAPAEIGEWLNWADVVNTHDGANIENYRKPIIKTYHGSYYRQRWQEINQADKALGYHQTALTIDLSLFGPRWIGRPIETLKHKPDKKSFRVCHAPTGRPKKGTGIVEEALGDLDGITLEIIENVTNAECLKRKARAHVLVDQIGPAAIGYGTNALEAWALGMPVVSCARPHLLEAIKNRAGYVPFINAPDARTLRNVIARLVDDPDYYAAWAEIGKQYLIDHHTPQGVAAEFVTVCEAML